VRGLTAQVIMPSYTFVSSANAFALRGAKVVFVDVRYDTINLDETKVEAAITPRTKAIVVVHYGGIAAEMDALVAIARRHKVLLIEDAAHAVQATYKGAPLGGLGDMGTFSFHYTKNVICGEGGALLARSADLTSRAFVVWEKGTNRHQFVLGKIDKYSWIDLGSSFLPSEVTAAFLHAQLLRATDINAQRLAVWNAYFDAFAGVEAKGLARRPVVPEGCVHNAHLFYLLVSNGRKDEVLKHLHAHGVMAVTHYVPLHAAPAAAKFGRAVGDLEVTNRVYEELIRLPLWPHMPPATVQRVIDATVAALEG
jgi:dTDP-4-amino-4,6-dideoxygalactose transaminase